MKSGQPPPGRRASRARKPVGSVSGAPASAPRQSAGWRRGSGERVAHCMTSARPRRSTPTTTPSIDHRLLAQVDADRLEIRRSPAAATRPSRPACSASTVTSFSSRATMICRLRTSGERCTATRSPSRMPTSRMLMPLTLQQVMRARAGTAPGRSGNGPRCAPRRGSACRRHTRPISGRPELLAQRISSATMPRALPGDQRDHALALQGAQVFFRGIGGSEAERSAQFPRASAAGRWRRSRPG